MKKTALVTGASRGIGAAIARHLAKMGYSLILTCKSDIRSLNELCDELNRDYKNSTKDHDAFFARAVQCDSADYMQVENLFKSIPSLDILVNNAGISVTGLLHEMSLEEWNAIINTNLSGIFYHCKFAIPLMLKEHSGKIINISSVWGNMGASMEVAYSASKGGVNSFTKALARELAPSNIQVNAIACGIIDTNMNAHLSSEDMDEIKKEIPADRIGQVSDIAKTVELLINAPDYMTGQIITVDGGWT